MSDQETVTASRRATFKAATQRLHPYRIASALNRLTRGLDWHGCTKNNRNEIVVLEGPADRLMKCKRPLPPYIEAGKRSWKEDWVTELRKMFCGTKITNGLCPHRGIPASAMIREGDVLTCPGHGLRFNATTGEALNTSDRGGK